MITNKSSESRDFRLEAYQYLKANPSGFRDDLIEEIKEPLFSEFRDVGILREGMDGNWRARYKVTDLGMERVDTILELDSMKQRLLEMLQSYSEPQ